MEATIFTGWIYDHLLPHAQQVKVAHPLMLRAIAAAKKKNDRIDAGKIADCLRCDFLPECHVASTQIRDRLTACLLTIHTPYAHRACKQPNHRRLFPAGNPSRFRRVSLGPVLRSPLHIPFG